MKKGILLSRGVVGVTDLTSQLLQLFGLWVAPVMLSLLVGLVSLLDLEVSLHLAAWLSVAAVRIASHQALYVEMDTMSLIQVGIDEAL